MHENAPQGAMLTRMMNQFACGGAALTTGPAVCMHAAAALSGLPSVFQELGGLAAILERLYLHDIVEVTVVHDPNPTGPVQPGQQVVIALPAAEGLAGFAARHDMYTVAVPRETLMPERRLRRAPGGPLEAAA